MSKTIKFRNKIWTARSSKEIISLFSACAHVKELFNENEIAFDLSDATFFHPFGLCLLVGGILNCQKENLNCFYNAPEKKKTREFLESIGFNNIFGLRDDLVTGFEGSAPHLQIKCMNAKNIYMATRIVDILARKVKMTDGVKDSLAMSLNELMNNAFDHSESAIGCVVCVQAYPSKQKIIACLMDFGIGITVSLAKNKKLKKLREEQERKLALKMKNNKDILTFLADIELAFQEGISSLEGSRGLGLTRLNDFLKINKGEFTVISGNATFKKSYLENKELRRVWKNVFFEGTGIEFVVRTDKKGLYALRNGNEEGDYLF